jgi:hypothetical protein
MVTNRFETIKAAPAAKKPISDTVFQASPQAQAGRQLSSVALLPVLRNVSCQSEQAGSCIPNSWPIVP